MIEDPSHFFIELFRRLVEVNGKRHIRLARTVFAHVLRLFIKAGIDRIVFVPGDQTSGPGVLGIHKPIVNSWYIFIADVAGPCVLVPSTMSIHLK